MQIARSLSRRFLAAPIVWSAATLSLALGIGAATAVFSVVNSLSLRNLPVAAPQRLVMLTSASDAIEGRPGTYSYATFDEVRRRDLFAGALAWSPASLAVNDVVEPVSALWVSGDFFATLGVPAAVGGTLSSADDVPGGGPRGFVAMISDRLWERQFGRAPGAIGSQMVVEKTPVTIIGVTPRSFRGVEIGRAYDLYLPFRVQPQIAPNTPSSPDAAILGVMLRLRDGQSLAGGINALRLAQPAIRAASAPAGAIGYLEEPFLLLPSGRGPSALRERYEAALVALLAVAILALLVGCANVANLTMVHGVTRR